MRPRRWVIVVVLAVALMAAAAYQGMRVLEKRYDVKSIITARIAPAIGGILTVSGVRFGFLSILFENVRIVLPLRSVDLSISTIKVGISLSKLLVTRGDVGRSISTIILINPRLALTLPATATADSGRAPPAFSPASFPVSTILVKDGTVLLREADGYEVPIGAALNGKLHDETDGIAFSMRGKVASEKRNFVMSGMLGRGDADNRLSVRFDRARITRPIRFKPATIDKGSIDGTAEFLFHKSRRPRAFEASGWVHFSGVAMTPAGSKFPLEDVTFTLAMKGTRFTVDSLRARWNGVPLSAHGSWDAADTGAAAVSVAADSMDICRLLPGAPKSLLSSTGGGWATAELRRRPGRTGTLLTFAAGGASLVGAPVRTCSAAVVLAGDTVTIDSATVATAFMRIAVNGSVTTDSEPYYHLTGTFDADSLPSFPDVRTRLGPRRHQWKRTRTRFPGIAFRLRSRRRRVRARRPALFNNQERAADRILAGPFGEQPDPHVGIG